MTGCSWVSAEHVLGGRVSDTTLRARRDEWIDAGVFDALVSEALAGYDRIVGLDLSEVSVDGSQDSSLARQSGGLRTASAPLRVPPRRRCPIDHTSLWVDAFRRNSPRDPRR